MNRPDKALRILLIGGAVVAVVGVGIALALPDEEQLARRAEAALEKKFGVPVTIGGLHWQLLPVPMVEVTGVATRQDEPVVLRRLAAWPRLGALLRREIAFERVLLDGATIPQRSLRAFGADGKDQDPDPWLRLAGQPVARAEFRDLTWVDRRGIALELEGHADFDTGWRPREAAIWRTGVHPPARLELHRVDGQDRWRTEIAVAGGSWDGTLVLQQPATGRYRLAGELDPRGVELKKLLETFGRKPVIAGLASGHTTLEAEGEKIGDLVKSLHTRTRFSVDPATVLGFDLAGTIRSLGRNTRGSTRLDTLTGVLDTQAHPDGVIMKYSALEARSGALSARGTVVLQSRRIQADVVVDLVDGVAGVPLTVTGPTRNPTFGVPPSAIAGAVAGTVVAPVVGTVVGARVGGTIGKAIGRIFGGGDGGGAAPAADRSAAPAAPERPPARRRAVPSGPPSTR